MEFTVFTRRPGKARGEERKVFTLTFDGLFSAAAVLAESDAEGFVLVFSNDYHNGLIALCSVRSTGVRPYNMSA